MIEFKTTLTTKERYLFAALLPVFFALVGWFVFRRTGNREIGWWLCGGSLVISVLGIVWPPLLRGVFVLWMALAFPFGWIMSHLILFGIFFLVITPVALLMKLIGFDPLHRRADPNAATYWETRRLPSDTRRYFRQF